MPTFIDAFGEYKTLRDWSQDPRCLVSLMTLEKRVKSGWPAEDALTRASDGPADRLLQKVTAFSETKSIRDWVADPRSNGNAAVIRRRISEGWEEEAAVATPAEGPSKQARRVRLYHGKSIPEWLIDPRCTVSRFTLERNLRAHMPIEEALTFRKRRRAERPKMSHAIERQLSEESGRAASEEGVAVLVGRRST